MLPTSALRSSRDDRHKSMHDECSLPVHYGPVEMTDISQCTMNAPYQYITLQHTDTQLGFLTAIQYMNSKSSNITIKIKASKYVTASCLFPVPSGIIFNQTCVLITRYCAYTFHMHLN